MLRWRIADVQMPWMHTWEYDMTTRVTISDHAYRRAHQRVRVGRRALRRLASRILEEGIALDTATQSGMIFALMRHQRDQSVWPVIYGGAIYIFRIEGWRYTLVTVLDVPKKLLQLIPRDKGQLPDAV